MWVLAALLLLYCCSNGSVATAMLLLIIDYLEMHRTVFSWAVSYSCFRLPLSAWEVNDGTQRHNRHHHVQTQMQSSWSLWTFLRSQFVFKSKISREETTLKPFWEQLTCYYIVIHSHASNRDYITGQFMMHSSSFYQSNIFLFR